MIFQLALASENGFPSTGHDIAHSHGGAEPLPKLDLYLIQPGQDNWDTIVAPTPAEYTIRINTSYGGLELKDNTGELAIMDLLQAMYNLNNNLAARMVVDQYRVRYESADRLFEIACPDEPLNVHLADETYSKDDLVSATVLLANWQESNSQDLLEHKYTFINTL